MKHVKAVFALVLIAGVVAVVNGQQVFTSDKTDYILELPTDQWRSISEADAEHEHVEFVNRDRLEGHLRIRKEAVDAGTAVSDLARRDLDQKLRFLPGFVEGKQEKCASLDCSWVWFGSANGVPMPCGGCSLTQTRRSNYAVCRRTVSF